jgi:hypothetical protein
MSFEFVIKDQKDKPEKKAREIAVVVEASESFNKKIVPESLLTIVNNDNDLEGGIFNDSSSAYTRNIKSNKYKFQLVPNRNNERDIIYCTGQSGSGKSYWTAQYCIQYKRIYPKNKIYLISSLHEDETLDKLNDIEKDFFIRIDITPNLITDQIGAKDFENSLVIFDDFECLKNKALKTYVCGVRDEILEVGRHHKTSMICTYHLPTNSHDTRRIINEAHAVVFFPHVSNFKIKNLLENYLGMHKDFLAWTKRKRSRWACILRGFPNMFINDNEVWLTNELQDEYFK